MPWYAKIEQGIVDKTIFDHYVPAHINYVKHLNTLGHKAQTGYWKERGGGMLIFEAACLDEAQAIVAQDPLVSNGCVTYELHEWCVVVGEPEHTHSSQIQPGLRSEAGSQRPHP